MIVGMRVKVSFVAAFAVLAFGAALASCGPGGGSAAPVPCVPPAGVQVALIYPAPGSTAIPDAVTQVIIAASGPLPATFDVALTATSGQAYFGQVLPAASPFPSPAATPPFANPTYYTSTNGGYTFASQTLLTAQINDLNSNCTPGSSLGSFTTQ